MFYNEWTEYGEPQSDIVKYFLYADWLAEELIEEIYGTAPLVADLESDLVNI